MARLVRLHDKNDCVQKTVDKIKSIPSTIEIWKKILARPLEIEIFSIFVRSLPFPTHF